MGILVVLEDFLICLLNKLALVGIWKVFLVIVAAILEFSVEEGFESQLRKVICWEGSTWFGVRG